MANRPIPCPACGSARTRVRDTTPVRPECMSESVCGTGRVQLLECYSCPPDDAGRPRIYQLTYPPPTFVVTVQRYLRQESRERHR
jgi:hypothetical protein